MQYHLIFLSGMIIQGRRNYTLAPHIFRVSTAWEFNTGERKVDCPIIDNCPRVVRLSTDESVVFPPFIPPAQPLYPGLPVSPVLDTSQQSALFVQAEIHYSDLSLHRLYGLYLQRKALPPHLRHRDQRKNTNLAHCVAEEGRWR